MIETLRIENVAILDRAELEFGPGLNVLTGETGAGKSIVLGALAMLAGTRASAEAIRSGCDSASVEAVFRTGDLPELEAELAARGLEAADHELIVQRTLSRSGRGRARVSGELVPVTALAELFGGRIEISSQHDSQALLRPETHGALLDRSGGVLAERTAVADAHAALRALDDELAALRAAAQERARRQDFLAFQIQEIDAAALDAGAVERLEGEHARLAHADRLRADGGAALCALLGEPGEGDAAGAADRLADAARRLATLARLDPALAPHAERLAGLAADAREAGYALDRYLEGVEADPARLASLDDALARLEGLKRKYGAGVEEILRFRAGAAAELASIEGDDARAGALEQRRAALADTLGAAAAALSKARRAAAKQLARRVTGALEALGMPNARFEVGLDPLAPPPGLPSGPGGLEHPEFRFGANAGEALQAFRKVASGGELSRVFLALKGALRGSARGMVLVFDEVDAGVGGRAADRVGRALAELASHHQVLCITHLPQIAAFADVHLRVEKRTRGGRTLAALHRVEGKARVEEIARMAGGEAIGEATLRHAQELLKVRGPTA